MRQRLHEQAGVFSSGSAACEIQSGVEAAAIQKLTDSFEPDAVEHDGFAAGNLCGGNAKCAGTRRELQLASFSFFPDHPAAGRLHARFESGLPNSELQRSSRIRGIAAVTECHFVA